ncbi:MAG: PorP/SprF family type IX secretion system membrane protein [Bacteroidia bacterium]|nr:PorP/SprF family type IX secretion system membrane protein [Bacteroidia bacterium]
MKKTLITLAAITVFFANTYSQQSPLFGFSPYFLNISNPSASKTINPVDITLAGRKYWTGINGSPEAYLGSFTLSPESHKSAFGGFFWQEKAPMIKKNTFGFNYAYSIKDAGEENNFRLGLGLDFSTISSNTNEIIANDYNDPFYNSLFGNYKSSVDLRTGISFVNSTVDVGIAIRNLLSSKSNIGESINGSMEFNNRFAVNGYMKYIITQSDNFKITPLVYWEAQKSVPLRVDLNLLAESTGKLWGGIMLRPKASFAVLAGIWALQDVKVGYLYEKTFFRSMSAKGNSHEIMISYAPNLKSKKIEEVKPEKKEKTEVKPPKIVRVRDTLVIIKEVRIKEKEEPKKSITEKETPKYESDNTKPKEPKKEEPKKTTKDNPNMKFYVVVGAFSIENNANNLVSKLKEKGYNPFIVMDKVKNHYNVSVGKFSTREDAQKYIAENAIPDYTFWVKEILP